MSRIAIRCRPRDAGAAAELEGWLRTETDRLGSAPSPASASLLRLGSAGDGGGDAGWLVELEVADRAGPDLDAQLAPVLTDMRLLGLDPTVLVER